VESCDGDYDSIQKVIHEFSLYDDVKECMNWKVSLKEMYNLLP